MDLLAFRYIQTKFPVGAISTRRFLWVQKRINFHTISSPIEFIKKFHMKLNSSLVISIICIINFYARIYSCVTYNVCAKCNCYYFYSRKASTVLSFRFLHDHSKGFSSAPRGLGLVGISQDRRQ